MRTLRVQAFLLLSLLLKSGVATRSFSHKKNGVCVTNRVRDKALYTTQTLRIPVDHFHNESRYEPHSSEYFENRYWFDDSHYIKGGPVIIYNGGEDNAVYSLPDMQIGLLHELAKATNGIAVVLEHRYYGETKPVNKTHFTTEDFRFLSAEQAMADQAYFARNVKFPGKEQLNLTAPNTPWFVAGCSYSGGLSAFERIQYPELFWGAISSSGVTAPKADYWEYDAAVREYSPQDCVDPFAKIINIADNIILGGNKTLIQQLKGVLGLEDTKDNADFASYLYFGYTLQIHNWLPCYNKFSDMAFCTLMASSELEIREDKAKNLEGVVEDLIANGGWANETETLTTNFLNYIGYSQGWLKSNVSYDVEADAAVPYHGKDLTLGYSWPYQQCTELGWFQTGGGPQYPLPIISRLVTVDYVTKSACLGQFNLSGLPNTEPLKKYGFHNVSYPRLMLVGGEKDPWRPATPLATLDVPTRLNTTSTLDEPWVLIEGGTHCWDWLGVFQNQTDHGFPPEKIKEVHQMEIDAFKRWLEDWHRAHPSYKVEAEP